MEIQFGFLLVGGLLLFFAVTSILRAQKEKKQVMEIKYMQTTPIADAIDLVETMSASDPTYRHYVELKGVAHCDSPVRAPLSGKEAVYFENKSYSVSEESVTVTRNGRTTVEHRKKENLISEEASSVPVYITDSSSSEKIYIDMDSFGEDLELQVGCDRFEDERVSSSRIPSQQYRDYARTGVRQNNGFNPRDLDPVYNPAFYQNTGGRFLGFKYVENILNVNQPLYILGEMYKGAAGYRVGKAMVSSSNQSKLTYKSEDQLVDETAKSSKNRIVMGAVCAVVGVILIIMAF